MIAKSAKKSFDTLALTRMAMLYAVALLLAVLEGMIPPLPSMPPGVKLGLSNVVVMYCLVYLGWREGLLIVALKALFAFLVQGGFTAGLMSLFGGLCSAFVIILLLALKKLKISFILVSVCAAVTHNLAQLAVACFYLQSSTVFYYTPVLFLSGIVMGCVTGVVLRVMLPAMRRLRLAPIGQPGKKKIDQKGTRGRNVDSN